MTLAMLAIAGVNSAYLFTRHRNYDMQLRSVRAPWREALADYAATGPHQITACVRNSLTDEGQGCCDGGSGRRL